MAESLKFNNGLLASTMAGSEAIAKACIVPASKDSVPLEGEDLKNRDDIETFDSKKVYKGEYVKVQAGDDEFILGKAYPQGSGSIFVPCDPSAPIEHMGTLKNHLQTAGNAAMNIVNQTCQDFQILEDYSSYVIGVLTFDENRRLNALSDISSINEEKERINKYYRDKSAYKAAYDADNSIINLAMAVDGIGGLVSSVTKAPKLLNGGIKVTQFASGALGLERTVKLSLSAIGSVAGAGAYGLLTGSSINNMVGNSSFENFNPETGTNKQKGNYGESKSADNMLNNQSLKDAGYDLESVGRDAPTAPDDKIVKGIDGLYKNNNPDSDIKYVIDEAKFGKSQLGTTKDGPQMSNDWLTGTKTGNNRILKAVDEDEKLANDITKALKKGQVERVLSKIDSEGNVTTYRLDNNGEIFGVWP